jgi:hypothetical protein
MGSRVRKKADSFVPDSHAVWRPEGEPFLGMTRERFPDDTIAGFGPFSSREKESFLRHRLTFWMVYGILS